MMGSMLRRGAISGDGATLSLDFTTGTLDPLLTFTRSSSGTYLGSDGLVKTAGTNVARFQYDTSGNPMGLLIEGSATNLLAHTERLDEAQVSTEQYWITTYSVTGVTDAVTGPDGVSNSATQFTPIGGNGTCIASAAMGTSAQRSFSFYAKQSSGTTNLEYTLDNGTTWVAVTTTSSWQRFTIAATTAAQRVGFRFATNNVYEIWGCQLEAGSGGSTYIKNVSSAAGATRNADMCVMENITSCNYNTKTGTLFYAGRFTQMNASSFPNRFGFTRETGDLRAFYALSTTTALLPGYSNGATSVLTTQNITLNSELKLAISFDADLSTAEVKSSLNGAAIVQSGASALTESNAPTYFMLGQKGYGAFFPHGTVRSVKYWPTALPNAQLQALTT